MAPVPGSLFRRILFWTHLGSAVVAGVFIFVMSASGVLLAYERQMTEAAARRNHVEAPPGAVRMDADQLAQIARSMGANPSLVFQADPLAPVTVTGARDGSVLLNPFDGSVIQDASTGRRDFFRIVKSWHRYLGGESSSARASLMDYGNLLFVFIILTGIYIWLPKVWRWRNLSAMMFFQKKYINAKTRDYNWHHVFSFWMLIPLFIIALSGVMISFPWANKLVYAAYGEEVPARRGNNQGGAAAQAGAESADGNTAHARFEVLRQSASEQMPGWTRLTLPLAIRGAQLDVTAEIKSTEVRPPRQTVTLSTSDGAVIRVQPPQSNAQTPGQRARSWLRFAHTGEQYGFIGQTIAGIASLAACFLVYTGLALAWRRLIRPLYRRGPA